MLLYFQVCSNSAHPQHSGELYRTNGPMVFKFEQCCLSLNDVEGVAKSVDPD